MADGAVDDDVDVVAVVLDQQRVGCGGQSLVAHELAGVFQAGGQAIVQGHGQLAVDHAVALGIGVRARLASGAAWSRKLRANSMTLAPRNGL
jgi:hypothetical protein